MKGTQVSYGKFNPQGEIVNDVTLNPFGDVNQVTSVCTNFYIGQNDYLTSISYRYNEAGVQQLWLTTINGKSNSFGRADPDDASIVEQFTVEDKMFYGFFGIVENYTDGQKHLRSLGLIVYDYVCLRDEKARLGENFKWGNEEEVIEEETTTPAGETGTQTGEEPLVEL